MTQLVGPFRIGRDAEVRYPPGGGDAVSTLSLAYNFGKKGQDGKRPTQWVEAALWGKRAEALAPYLLKGAQIYAVLSDVHIETYQKSGGGEGVKLSARVMEIELLAGQQAQQQPDRQQQPANQGQNRQAGQGYQQPQGGRPAPSSRINTTQPRGSSGFDDMDDDIPF